MLRITYILAYVITSIVWGDWRRWREYYPTILYVNFGTLAYNVIFYDYTLWRYDGLVNDTFSTFLYLIFANPCGVVLFFTFFPKTKRNVPLYILLWAAVNSVLEGISVLLHTFSYEHGWSFLWSVGVFICGFGLIALHKNHPVITWALSALACFLVMIIFEYPLSVMK